MKNLLTRYRPRFVRSLVYMLQTCEYDVHDYLAWYHRTRDFAHVEVRKTLDPTQKALALLRLTWVLVVAWCVSVMAFAASTGSDVPLVVGAGVVLLLPFYLPYGILIPLFILKQIQRPLEARRIRDAKKILNAHNGVKIAISGSYGKTTMREILKTVLSTDKKVAAPQGSYNTPLGIASFVHTLAGDEDIIIFELGEYYPGDVKMLCEFVRPDIGIITGVNEAHLEKFGTLEKTAATIFELADYLGDTPVYVNEENEGARAKAREGDLLFSRAGVHDWRVVNPNADLRGTTCTLVRGAIVVKVSSKLLGMHMLGPLAVAADIAWELGLPVSRIEEGIQQTEAFPHRLQPTVDNTGVITLDDSYNGNPDGVAAVITFLSSIKGRRRFYITPGLVEMGTRKESVHEEIGKQLAEAGIENVVLIRTTATPFVESGLQEAGFKGKILRFDDMPSALHAVTHMTVSGDIVLIQNDWPDQYS